MKYFDNGKTIFMYDAWWCVSAAVTAGIYIQILHIMYLFIIIDFQIIIYRFTINDESGISSIYLN